jgi:hypothetical protein
MNLNCLMYAYVKIKEKFYQDCAFSSADRSSCQSGVPIDWAASSVTHRTMNFAHNAYLFFLAGTMRSMLV